MILQVPGSWGPLLLPGGHPPGTLAPPCQALVTWVVKVTGEGTADAGTKGMVHTVSAAGCPQSRWDLSRGQ